MGLKNKTRVFEWLGNGSELYDPMDYDATPHEAAMYRALNFGQLYQLKDAFLDYLVEFDGDSHLFRSDHVAMGHFWTLEQACLDRHPDKPNLFWEILIHARDYAPSDKVRECAQNLMDSHIEANYQRVKAEKAAQYPVQKTLEV